MKKELILKGRTDTFNHIWWRFMMQKKFVESISVRLMCDRCGSRRNEVMWCQSVWWDKGTGLMWTDGMHALWDGGKDAVQTGTMHLTRDPKMHHAFVFFFTYTYIFWIMLSLHVFITVSRHLALADPSPLSWARPRDTNHQLTKTLRGAPFCLGILSFFLMHESIVNHFYTCFLPYNAMDETRQVAWISKGRANSNLK